MKTREDMPGVLAQPGIAIVARGGDEWELHLTTYPGDESPTDLTAEDVRVRTLLGPELYVVGLRPREDGVLVVTLALATTATYRSGPTAYLLSVQTQHARRDQLFTLQTDVASVAEPLDELSFDDEHAAPIDYLSKDYRSFRQLMLEQIEARAPGWDESQVADIGQTLVEAAAFAADRLSLFQDAVATEAYLETARLRTSLERHTRLVDYRLSNGCNARVWVVFEVTGPPCRLPAETYVYGPIDGAPVCVDGRARSVYDGPVFQTMHEAQLDHARNRIDVHAFGQQRFTLPAGAIAAALRGHHSLRRGELLLLEEQRPGGRSHVVRLSEEPLLERDDLTGTDLTICVWHRQDALPFDLVVADAVHEGSPASALLVARGNVVLADHGETVASEHIELRKFGRTLSAGLGQAGLTFARELPSTFEDLSATSLTLGQGTVRPECVVEEHAATAGRAPHEWSSVADLLHATPFTRAFQVETETDGEVRLRFGNGEHGRRPNPERRHTATYRIGNGSGGNLGPGVLAHVEADGASIVRVRNPLPAWGGEDPETDGHARVSAPIARDSLARCVTDADFEYLALQQEGVDRARVQRRWNGHTTVVSVFVASSSNQEASLETRRAVQDALRSASCLGVEVVVRGARMLGVELELRVTTRRGQDAGAVRNAAVTALETSIDELDLAEPLTRSRVESVVTKLAGVEGVEFVRFATSADGADAPPVAAVLTPHLSERLVVGRGRGVALGSLDVDVREVP